MASGAQQRLTGWIERLLDLRRGELGRGLLLSIYLFLIIAAYVIGKVARDALFLDRFQAIQLPYADIGVALLVGFVVAGCVQISKYVSLSGVLLGTLLASAAISLLFWSAAHYYHPLWLYPVVYVWIGIFGVLAPAQVWTFANYVLTTREAKRLFGLVGAGAVTGWIFAGIFSSMLAHRFGAESLLLAMTLLLVPCAIPVVVFLRRSSAPQELAPPGCPTPPAVPTMRRSLQMIWSSRYLRVIAILICVSSFVTTIAGWQFKAIAKQFFTHKDALAAFFGDFNFYAGCLALVLQLLLTSRLLRRFGIGPALLIVPLALMAASASVLVWGTLLTVVLLKGGDQVLRYSLDKATVELLYLPVAANVKVQTKSFIDTVIWRLGDGLAGISLLLFATYLHVPARQIGWITLLLAPAWVVAALYCRRSYVVTLRDAIRQHQLDVGVSFTSVLDRDATMEIIRSNLSARDTAQTLYTASLFELERHPTLHHLLRDRLGYPAPAVRQKAIAVLRATKDASAAEWVQPLLRDPDLEVRTEALLYLAECCYIDPLERIEKLGDFSDFSIRAGMAAFLASPGKSQNLVGAGEILDRMVHESGPAGRRIRLEAARLLASLSTCFPEQLSILLADSDHEVAREAIRTVVKRGQRRFLPPLIERLEERDLAGEIQIAVTAFGDSVTGLLRDYLLDSTQPAALRRRIPPILAKIASQSATNVLVESLPEMDTRVRTRILAALREIRKRHPEIKLDGKILESTLAGEINEHYRSYQILQVLGDECHATPSVLHPLQEAIQHQLEHIFAILALRYPQPEVVSAYFGVQSKNPTVHDNALEFLDNVLDPELRRKLVPLLDVRIAASERGRLAEAITGAGLPDLEQAVAYLLESHDPWLKRCGAGAAAAYGLRSFECALESCATDSEPLVREAARQARTILRVPTAEKEAGDARSS